MAESASRCIVLTGVSRGLGLAMAEGFIERGHTVHGCARSADALKQVRKRFGGEHTFEVVDVTRDDQVRAWALRVLGAGSMIDLLINNAGVINRNSVLWEVPADEFARVVDVNINGVTHVIRHFAPAMVARGRGVIVNFSSGWGRSVSAEVAPYCATKYAIEGLTKALAAELPSGMAAVPLNPGIIDTDMLRSCFGEAAANYPGPTRWAAKAVPFLLKLGPKDSGQSLSVPE
jgi:NAD(P)-dependent dehydrogenase (short-subunit alcohol dehydrogenase family)